MFFKFPRVPLIGHLGLHLGASWRIQGDLCISPSSVTSAEPLLPYKVTFHRFPETGCCSVSQGLKICLRALLVLRYETVKQKLARGEKKDT